MSILQSDAGAGALGQVNRHSEMQQFLIKHPPNMTYTQLAGK